MSKYYKVLRETPYWEKGAIIKKDGDNSGYTPLDDLFLKDIKGLSTENYVESCVVESQPEWFERVYEVRVLGKARYLAKEHARKAHEDLYKEGK